MLTLILGTDWVANRNEILTRIAADVRCRKPGRVLMVPELISHEMERKLCEFAGDTASRYAEVLSLPVWHGGWRKRLAPVPSSALITAAGSWRWQQLPDS